MKLKNIAIGTIFVFAACAAWGQKNFADNIRYEVTELTVNNEEYSLFMYKDTDGDLGYYLSLGHAERIMSIGHETLGTLTVDRFDETCLCLGFSTEDAYATLDTLLAMTELETGTTMELPARMTYGSDRLGDMSTAICMVQKPLIGGKRLVFLFESGQYMAETYLKRSSIKQLHRNLKFYKKLHPDK